MSGPVFKSKSPGHSFQIRKKDNFARLIKKFDMVNFVDQLKKTRKPIDFQRVTNVDKFGSITIY